MKHLLLVLLSVLLAAVLCVSVAGATVTSGTVAVSTINSGSYTAYNLSLTSDSAGRVTATSIASGVGELLSIETAPGATNPTTTTYALVLKDAFGYALTQGLTGACSASAAELWRPHVMVGDGTTTGPKAATWIPVLGGVDMTVTGMSPTTTAKVKMTFQRAP